MAGNANSRQGVDLARLLDEPLLSDVRISGLQLDSRQVRPGDLFLAMPGHRQDGRDYIGSAVAAGAVAVLAEAGLDPRQRAAADPVPLLELVGLSARLGPIAAAFHGNPGGTLFVAGITGTNGKTTTSRLAAQLLRGRYGQCGVIGTLGAVLDDRVAEAQNTTPDAIQLQRQLARWRAQGVGHVTLEVSSHGLEQGRINGAGIDTAVFTNLTHDHLDYHGDMQQYAAAKTRLFALDSVRTAVINRDDDFAASLQRELSKSVELLDYSLRSSRAALGVANIRHANDGIRARLRSPWGQGELHCPLPADFNLANLLAAIGVAASAGLTLPEILEQAPTLRGVPGRMEYVSNRLGLQLVVDYAHTPDALLQALSALRVHTSGQLICVFGCGGGRDAEKRPLMGRVATERADRVIVTSDNPRDEAAAEIIEQVLAGCESGVEVESDRATAIANAVRSARPGDCVLVAGKGHECYQQVGEHRLPFSDVQQLRLAAAGKEQ